VTQFMKDRELETRSVVNLILSICVCGVVVVRKVGQKGRNNV